MSPPLLASRITLGYQFGERRQVVFRHISGVCPGHGNGRAACDVLKRAVFAVFGRLRVFELASIGFVPRVSPFHLEANKGAVHVADGEAAVIGAVCERVGPDILNACGDFDFADVRRHERVMADFAEPCRQDDAAYATIVRKRARRDFLDPIGDRDLRMRLQKLHDNGFVWR